MSATMRPDPTRQTVRAAPGETLTIPDGARDVEIQVTESGATATFHAPRRVIPFVSDVDDPWRGVL